MARVSRRLVACVKSAGFAIAVMGAVPRGGMTQPIAASTLKAAFMLNFVKFTEWPARATESPILLCVFGDEGIADALTRTVSGQMVNGRALQMAKVAPNGAVRDCHLLFVVEHEPQRLAAILQEASQFPVLTVSDIEHSSRHGVMIELLLANGRLRFAVNIDTMERSSIKLSSRLLALAQIVRDPLAR
jgi:hypothetical protein